MNLNRNQQIPQGGNQFGFLAIQKDQVSEMISIF